MLSVDVGNLWKQTLGALEIDLDPAVIATWFKNTHIYETTENKIIIACPDSYSRNIIENRYAEKIRLIISAVTGQKIVIEFIVKPQKIQQTMTGPLFDEAPQNNSRSNPNAQPTSITNQETSGYKLNTSYTLDKFIVGISNRVVHAAAVSVVESPGQLYNPLFIYGPSGVGKTHLLHAIGNAVKEKNPDLKIVYTSTEQFVNDMIMHIRQKKDMQAFRNKYRASQLLLIDDIQFLSGKESSQEEFYHTFNELYQLNNQIVIASDREPSQLSGVADRLISRFKGGLMTMISPPDYETRLAIVYTRANELGLILNDSICQYIAERAIQNIREIYGLMLQIKSYTVTHNDPLTLHLIKSIINPGGEPAVVRRKITPELIFDLVTNHFNTNMKELCGKKRTQEIVTPRQLTMFLLRNELGMNLKEIGNILGGRDHTTVMHGCERVKSDIESNLNVLLKNQLATIRQELYS